MDKYLHLIRKFDYHFNFTHKHKRNRQQPAFQYPSNLMTKKVFKAFSGSHALHTNHAKAMEKLAQLLLGQKIPHCSFC